MKAFFYGVALQWRLDIRSKTMLITCYLVPLLFFALMGGIFTSLMPQAGDTLIQSMTVMGVSMGALGALLVDRDSIWKSHPIPDLPMKEERGIGAAMVAGICLAAEKGNSPQDMLRCGIAAAGAAVSQEQNQLCSRLDFEQVLPQVSIQAL